MKKIILKSRIGRKSIDTKFFAIIDDEDYLSVSDYAWNYTIGYKNHPVTARCFQLNNIELDNFIIKPNKGLYIYHINNDRLDCRRENMVLLSKAQFEATKPPSKNNTSGLKGIRWKNRANAWVVEISVNRKAIYLGSFKNIIEAMNVYNEAAIRYHGDYAYINDIEDKDIEDIYKKLRIESKNKAAKDFRWGRLKKKEESLKIEKRLRKKDAQPKSIN